MAKYKVLASFIPVDGELVNRGEEVELSDKDAKPLLERRVPYVVPVEEAKAPAPETEPDGTQRARKTTRKASAEK